MIKLCRWDPETAAELMDLRARVFHKSIRDQSFLEDWLTDPYDTRATHVVSTDDSMRIIAAVRLIFGDRWPLEDKFPQIYPYKSSGVEFGRLVVEQRFYSQRRVLFDLIITASLHSISYGRPNLYGLVIVPFRAYLEQENVPLTVLSDSLRSYGERANAVHFNAWMLIDYYQRLTGERVVHSESGDGLRREKFHGTLPHIGVENRES